MRAPVGRPAAVSDRRLRTPPPAQDVPALFGGIERYARTATRLHPRPGEADPLGSHVGGRLRWPAGEPWPSCAAEHVVTTQVPLPAPVRSRLDHLRTLEPARRWPGYQQVLAELACQAPGFAGLDRPSSSAVYRTARPQPAPSPLVAVAQLHAVDIPDLRPPPGSDLLQVLWCPNDHDLGGDALAPATVLRWRCAADVPGVLARPPAPATVGHPAYLPRPCVLQPEQVVEYPWWQQLSTDLGYQVRGWDAEHGGQYHRQLAVAPGWKVGGWPQWPTTDPRPLYCTGCGGQLRQLLQLDSHEWGDPTRWRPVVEPASGEQPAGDAEPTGVIAGDTGLYRVFTCPSCPAHPDQPAAVHPDQPAAVHPDQPAAVHPDQPAAVRIDLQ